MANFKVGTLAKIIDSGYNEVEIVEDRGLLGPKGIRIYGVMADDTYIEVREDQLEVIDE